MKYDKISPILRKFIGSREAFRRLGFSADDLYFAISPSARLKGAIGGFVKLLTQGKEFVLELGPVEGNSDGLIAEYKRFCAAQDKVSQADMDRMWQESEPFQDKAGFVLALLAKGFVFPRMTN